MITCDGDSLQDDEEPKRSREIKPTRHASMRLPPCTTVPPPPLRACKSARWRSMGSIDGPEEEPLGGQTNRLLLRERHHLLPLLFLL